MFASIFFGRLTKFYSYPFSKVTFLLPLTCKSSLRTFASKRTPAITYGRRLAPRNKTSVPNQRKNLYTNPSKGPLKVEATNENKTFATEFVTQNTKVDNAIGTTQRIPPRKLTTLEGFQEFFSHPMTWDRNNGYFNILLGIAIFGYSFCTTCSPDIESSSYEDRKK